MESPNHKGNHVVIGVDVGGTNLKAAGVRIDGSIIGSVIETNSPSSQSAEQIIDGLCAIIGEVSNSLPEPARACGIGIPAPFDYEHGISQMDHKFQAIKGIPLGEAIGQRMGLRVKFVKDSVAFGLGVHRRQFPDLDRFIAVTIGTGLGSCFIDHGKSVEHGSRVPADGEIWCTTYNSGILEDIVSGRGIRALYLGKTGVSAGARTIEDYARNGDEAGIETYREVGEAIGYGFLRYYEAFKPQKLVVGGKIARATDLFGPAAEHILNPPADSSPFIVPAVEEALAIVGAATHAIS